MNTTTKQTSINHDGKQLDLSWQMFANIPNVIKYHFQEGNLAWGYVFYLGIAHITGLKGIFRLRDCSAETLIFAYLLWPITGYGVTVGAHRLWAHRTYEAHFLVRLYLMITNSMGYQRSIYDWAINHRLHHAYAETSKLVQFVLLILLLILFLSSRFESV